MREPENEEDQDLPGALLLPHQSFEAAMAEAERAEAARARALADEATAAAEKHQARARELEAQVGQQLVAYDDAMAAAKTRAAGLAAERDAARGELGDLRAQLVAKGNELPVNIP